MIDENAVSVLPRDNGIDEFPVLKAFQQYIDAEQNKARKRLMLLTAIFAMFMVLVVSVFVILLFNVTQRNQSLNDRLVEFAMQQNRPQGSAVVVQPAPDNSALLQLTTKLEEMRKNFEAEKLARKDAEQQKAKLEQKAAEKTTPQDLEILRLKNLLQIEKDKLTAEKEKVATEKAKVAAEKARQKEIELEAYRRKHYPELYEPTPKKPTSVKKRPVEKVFDDNDDEPISYFDDEDDSEGVKSPSPRSSAKPAASAAPTHSAAPKRDVPFKIPVETVKPQSSNRWRIPTE